MSGTAYEGWGPLRRLMVVRLRARVRSFVRSCRRPRRLLLVLVAAGFVALILVGQHAGGSEGLFGGRSGSAIFPIFLTFFFVSTALSATAAGVLSFSPAEVQLWFPAPIGTRALLAAHLLSVMVRSLSASIVFALFLRPAGASTLRCLVGYTLLFLFLSLLAATLDLLQLGTPVAVRRRRALTLGLMLLAVAAAVVALTLRVDGRFTADTLRHLGVPARPFVTLITATDGTAAWRSLGLVLAMVGVAALRPLTYRGNIREAADQASARIAKVRARAQRGQMTLDRTDRTTSGRLLPRLPHLLGAGPHLWRQLSVLRRKKRSYVMLLVLTALCGLTAAIERSPEQVALVMVAVLAVFGPIQVQCDFRSDYDALPYLRTLPSGPTALAAGQMLASALVITVLQVLAGGWVLAVAAPERRWIWSLGFLALPLLVMIQLAVENGAFLLYPHRVDLSRGPPGAVQIGRMYALMLVKFVVLGVALVPVIVLFLVLDDPLHALIASLPVLAIEVASLVWLVGELFERVDPSHDLHQGD